MKQHTPLRRLVVVLCTGFLLVACKSQGSVSGGLSPEQAAALPDKQVLEVWPGDPPGEPVWEGEGAVPETSRRNGRALQFVHTPTLEVRHARGANRTGAAVVVCPGGGYRVLADGHEGDAVAKWLNDNGITAVILRYRMFPYRHPVPMMDVQRAIAKVRANAEPWGIDPGRIGVLGFSAGGHLASTATVHHDRVTLPEYDAEDPVSSRPDFAVLIYPVISMREGVAHGGSRRNLLGPEPDDKLVARMSNDEQINAQTPPTFLVHSKDDKAVLIENSERFLAGLKKQGVPGELMVFETGGHGYGLGRGAEHETSAWPARCIGWLAEIGVIPAAK